MASAIKSKQSLNLLQAPKSARVRLWAATHGVFPAMYRSHGPSRAAVFAEASAARRPSACPLSSASSDLGLEEETTRWITVKQSFDPCAQTAQVPSMPLDSGPQVIPGRCFSHRSARRGAGTVDDEATVEAAARAEDDFRTLSQGPVNPHHRTGCTASLLCCGLDHVGVCRCKVIVAPRPGRVNSLALRVCNPCFLTSARRMRFCEEDRACALTAADIFVVVRRARAGPVLDDGGVLVHEHAPAVHRLVEPDGGVLSIAQAARVRFRAPCQHQGGRGSADVVALRCGRRTGRRGRSGCASSAAARPGSFARSSATARSSAAPSGC